MRRLANESEKIFCETDAYSFSLDNDFNSKNN